MTARRVPVMGRKIDLSGLTDNEAEHVLQVVQRDMRLRQNEQERLSELKQELDEEGSRCLLLSRQSCFNQRCCIRCCSSFTFLLNPKRQCCDCHYNICKSCRVYNKQDKAWLCSACQKTRLLKTQSLEWFYANVKKRFKRFGSAKVLKTLYRKHLAEHSALSELTEHSMAETLTVALRVAEEAVDEAISKAEFDTASQIISRRKTLAEMRAKYNQDWPFEQMRPRSSCDQASSSLKHQSGLSRSHSAFSLSAEDTPGMIQDSSKTLDKEGSGPTMSTWKSVDRLDNAVLKSPDGNWIALQSAQLSRPSLLTKRKSLVYSALERESGVVSAYEGMDSDNETKPELDSSWGAVLQEIHRKMTDSNLNLQDTQDWIPSTLMGRQSNKDELFSDPEGNWKSNKYLLAFLKRKLPAEIRRPSSFRRTSIIDVNFNTDGAGEEKHSGVCAEREVGRVRRSRKKRRSKKDKVAPSSGLDAHKDSDNTSDAVTPDTFTSGATTPEPLDHNCDITGHAANQTDEWLQQLAARASDFSDRGEELREERDEEQRMESRRGSQDQDEGNKIQWKMEIDMDEEGMEDEEGQEERDSEVDDEDMKDRLYRLVAQSRLTYFSSTDEELDKVGQGEAKWEEDRDMEEGNNEQNEGKTYGFSYRLSKLEKELQTTQFSSTEDELDRVAVDEQEDDEELGLKVCRLANQVDPTQFSSTEEELDTADRGKDEEEVMDEEALWKLQAEKAVQAVQLRDLACLVSTSQFSSTEDELDRLEENEGVRQEEVNGGGSESTDTKLLWGGGVERRESFGDLDVKMFDLRDGNESRDKKVTDDVLDSQTVIEDLKQEKTEVYEPGKADLLEGRLTGETEDDRIAVEELICGVNLGDEAKKANDKDVTQEIKLQTLELENQQERNWPDEKEGGEKFQMKWETTGDSTEEDAEFDRIISSMLMMTLEDMQVEAAENMRISRELEDGEAKDEERMEKVKVVGECRFKETVVGEKSPNNSEETGNVKELQRQGNTTPESAVREQTGHVSRNKERREAESRNGNEQEEKTRTLAKEKLGTNEAKDTCRQQEMDNEEPEDRRGKTVTVTAQTDNPKKEMEKKLEETERHPDDVEQSITSFLSPEEIQTGSDVGLYKTIELISTLLQQRYSAMSLCSITTEVYVAAGSVYSLEAELSDLEECAREICSSTSEMELSFLEEQVASAAAKVQQSELQIHDISARIAALKSAGLNVDTQKRFTKTRTIPVMPVTLDSSRQLRRRLPAPPVKEDKQT
ncbi:Rab effector MyRIP Exophilin-8 Myosin VIIa- and Rab-interacting protein [Channa argus]|uniref:Rab effector MyRIP Exophilin-8 Myosin VIIa-and Rab-interacting protein n=1 Tax=Channa argus TaxID=215402 RepID=A0A6G1Q8F9_CHAAH|nr:Rab effector MyRIP Exophilin-8 Myosin VIIa- and Rab-interacting protein [Channa argus]